MRAGAAYTAVRMRRMLAIAGLCVLAGAPDGAAQEAAAAPAVHTSTHYRFEVNGDIGDPAEYLRLAEALYTQLATYHGKTPPARKRLEVRFWRTKQAYLAGATADGIPAGVLNAGGYYAPSTKRAYFWRQPSFYTTRHLFLHELTHQFQYLSVLGGSRRPGQAWYLEGVAEEFAYHRWDGEHLVTGLSDIICLEKRIPNVKQRAREGTFDLAAVIEGRGTFDRGDYWGVVHFLRHGADARTQRRWKVLERKLWKGAGNGVVAKELLGGRRGPALAQAARAYVRAVPMTWKINWVNWDWRTDGIHGWSKTQASLCTHAVYQAAAFVEATVQPGPGRVVLSVGWRKVGDDVGLALEAGGRVHFTGRARGQGATVDAGKPVRLRLDADAGGVVRATVNGTALPEQRVDGNPAAGRIALLVGAGDRIFADVQVAPPPTQ